MIPGVDDDPVLRVDAAPDSRGGIPMEVTIDQVVRGAARAAYAAVYELDAADDHPTLDEADALDADAWDALEAEVTRIVAGAGPEYLHTMWLRGMVREGWAEGPIMSAVHRRSPEVVVWSRLPTAVQARKRLFVNVVRAFVVAADAS